MSTFSKTLTAMALAATALVLSFTISHTTASANEIEDYAEAMRSFTPVIQDWVDEVEATAEAAQAKPEILQSAELAELAMRGERIARDLEGTAAPGALAEAQAQLVDALGALAAATQAAGEASPEAYLDAIAEPQAAAEAKLRQINALARRAPSAPITIPVPPVSGN